VNNDLISGAVFSENGRFRYALWRFWNFQAAKNGNARAVMFIMGNPSIAGKYKDDPTIIKCAKLAQGWGYDGMHIGNLFALIDTHWEYDPKTPEVELVGGECDKWLATQYNSSVIRIAAWGFLGRYYPERVKAVRALFPELHYLELSQDGQPKHPLYLSMMVKPIPWEKE